MAALAASFDGSDGFIATQSKAAQPTEIHVAPNGLIFEREPGGEWVSSSPPFQQALRKSLLPETFIFAFEGYRSKEKMQDAIGEWINDVNKDPNRDQLTLVHLPKVIATKTQVCVSPSNTEGLDPVTGKWPILYLEPDANPLGTFLFYLLRKLQRVTLAPDISGLTPNPQQIPCSPTANRHSHCGGKLSKK